MKDTDTLKRVDKEDPPTKKINPISLPKGNYFTIPQMAEICNDSMEQIKRWIHKGDIEAIELPRMGQKVEMEKFTQFLNQRKPSGSQRTGMVYDEDKWKARALEANEALV